MKKIIYILFLLCTAVSIHAQSTEDQTILNKASLARKSNHFSNTTNYTPNIVYPSPQTQMFERYVDHPVEEYSGLANITIPLYDIVVDENLIIPITLNYHAGGIKYKSYDGEIGSGWSLSVGGYRVIRTIYGRPDEEYPLVDISEYNSWWKPEYKHWASDVRLALLASVAPINNSTSYLLNRPSNIGLVGYPNRREFVDGEYDHFRYMLPTNNGNFIITNRSLMEATILDNPMHSIQIKPKQAEMTINGMMMQDEKGFSYSFGSDSNGVNWSEECNIGLSQKYKTAWPLFEIKSPLGKLVNFEYQYIDVQNSNHLQLEKDTYLDPSIFVGSHEDRNYLMNGHFSRESPTIITPDNHKMLFVKEIKFNEDCKIEFHRMAQSETKELLKKIIIKKGDNILMEAHFDRFVHPSTLSEAYNLVCKQHQLLKSVRILDNQSSLVKKYDLEYYLPTKAQGVDQWGYYSEGVGTEYDNRFKKDRFISSLSGDINGVQAHAIYFNLTMANRQENKDPSAFSLKKISYPTGGHTQYIYEPNQWSLYKSNTIEKEIEYGMGQRIKEIIITPSQENEGQRILYKYGNNEDGNAKDLLNPIGMKNFHRFFSSFHYSISNYDHIVNSGWTEYHYPFEIYDIARTFSKDPLHEIPKSLSVAYYDVVAKYTIDSNKLSSGKVVSNYIIELNDSFKETPIDFPHNFLQITSELHMRPPYHAGNETYFFMIDNYRFGNNKVIKERKTYNADNIFLSHEKFNYTSHYSKKYDGLKVIEVSSIPNGLLPAPHSSLLTTDYGIVYKEFFLNTKVGIQGENKLLKSKEIISKTIKGDIKSEEVYTYDSLSRLIATTTTNSVGGIKTEFLTYPSVTAEKALIDNNMLSTVVQKCTNNNSKPVGVVKIIYPIDKINPSRIETSTSDVSKLQPEVFFDQYDAKGNLLQYRGKDEVPVSYVWSYNAQYPVAEFVNVNYSDAKNAINKHIGADITTLSVLSPIIESKLKSFPTSTQYIVKTYTYKPLVGITSETYPSGETTNYEYDSFGRLKRIKDTDGKVIEEYNYNYAK